MVDKVIFSPHEISGGTVDIVIFSSSRVFFL